MKELQKTQNKTICFLYYKRISDKVKTKSVLNNVNSLSVNQLNAEIKLTETWKALNNCNSSLNHLEKKADVALRASRASANGDLVEEGHSILALCTFQNDATRLWNRASTTVKSCKTLYSAKKEIRKFVLSLPI